MSITEIIACTSCVHQGGSLSSHDWWKCFLWPPRLLVSASQDGKLIIWDSYTTNKVIWLERDMMQSTELKGSEWWMVFFSKPQPFFFSRKHCAHWAKHLKHIMCNNGGIFWIWTYEPLLCIDKFSHTLGSLLNKIVKQSNLHMLCS